MDIGKAFTYVFDDPNWIMKVLIGGGILFVGLILVWLLAIPLLLAGIVILGYTVTTIRNVADGNPTPLPEWSDFGGLFMKGLYGLVGSIVFYLPVILIACCAGVVGAIPSMSKDLKNLQDTISIVTMCLNCVQGLLSLVFGVVYPAALIRYAMTSNQMSVFWDVGGTINLITKNLGNYVIAVLVAWVAGMIGMFGIILCGIGLPFTLFWSNLVGAFLYVQFWRASQAAGTVPAA